MSGGPRSLTVFTHTRPADTEVALRRVGELAAEAGVEVRLPRAELEKFEPIPGVSEAPDPPTDTDLALVLGGDGTILTALREFAGHGRAGVRGQLRRDRVPRDDRAVASSRRACAGRCAASST